VEQFLTMSGTAPASGRLLVLAAALCFATTGTAQELGPGGLEPVAVGAARIAVGGSLLALFAWWMNRRRPSWKRVREMPPVTLGAIAVAVAVYQLSFFAAVHLTGVAVGTVVALGSAPAFAGLANRLAGDEPLGPRWALSTALASAGVTLLVVAGAGATEIDPLGIGLALVSGSGYATYTVASKRLLSNGHAPEQVMACGFGVAALLLLPVLILAGGAELATPAGLGLALYLGLIPTALAYVLFARGLKRITAGETATLTLAEPLTAAALGVLVLGEEPGLLAGLGAAITLAGLVVLAMPAPAWPRRLAPAPVR
jgi:DME family drug/metabolite transporter